MSYSKPTCIVIRISVITAINSGVLLNTMEWVRRDFMRCKIHKYKLINISKTADPFLVYACQNCTHFISIKLAEGKANLCNECGKEHKLDSYFIRRRIVFPRCNECRTGVVEKNNKEIQTFIYDSILKDGK